MSEKPTLTEQNLSALMKKLKLMQESLSPISLPISNDKFGKIVEIFKHCCEFHTITSEDDAMDHYLNVKELLKRLEPETSKPIIPAYLKGIDRKHKIKCLFEWAAKQGVNLSGIDYFQHNASESKIQGFGIKAKNNFKQGDHIFEIPKTIIFSADKMKQHDVLAGFIKADPLLASMPNVLLAFGLIFEFYRGDSNWKCYLDSFPHEFSNISHFSTDDFNMLRGTSLFMEALVLWNSCIRQYAYLHMKFLDQSDNPMITQEMKSIFSKYDLANKFNLGDYLWAVGAVMTRVNLFPLSNNDPKPTLGLIPIMDLINHEDTVYSTDYDVEKQACYVCAPYDLKENEELKMFYGSRPNSLMLLHNGFYIDDNQYDFYLFKINKYINSSVFEKRSALFSKLALTENFNHPLSKSLNPWHGDLRSIYRICFCTDAEVNTLNDMDTSDLDSLIKSETGVSLNSELASKNKLVSHIQGILDVFPAIPDIPLSEKRSVKKFCCSYMKNERLLLEEVLRSLKSKESSSEPA